MMLRLICSLLYNAKQHCCAAFTAPHCGGAAILRDSQAVGRQNGWGCANLNQTQAI
jgi:hypothetical protein